MLSISAALMYSSISFSRPTQALGWVAGWARRTGTTEEKATTSDPAPESGARTHRPPEQGWVGRRHSTPNRGQAATAGPAGVELPLLGRRNHVNQCTPGALRRLCCRGAHPQSKRTGHGAGATSARCGRGPRRPDAAPARRADEGKGPYKTLVIRGAMLIDGTGASAARPRRHRRRGQQDRRDPQRRHARASAAREPRARRAGPRNRRDRHVRDARASSICTSTPAARRRTPTPSTPTSSGWRTA